MPFPCGHAAFSHLSSFSTCFKYILVLMFYYFTLMYLDMDSFYSTVWDLLSFLNLQPNFVIINSSTAFLLPPYRTPRDVFKSFHFYHLHFQFYNFTFSLLVALQFSFSSRIVSVVCCCIRNNPKTQWLKSMNQVSRVDPSGPGWAPLCIHRVGLTCVYSPLWVDCIALLVLIGVSESVWGLSWGNSALLW